MQCRINAGAIGCCSTRVSIFLWGGAICRKWKYCISWVQQ